MIEWFFDSVPWYVWAILIAIPASIAAFIWWPIILGIWNALPKWARVALGGFVAIGAAYLAGRNKGRSNEIQRQKERDVKAVYRRQQSDAAIEKMTPAEKKKGMEPWYRDE